jgi:hypothetical protein
MSTNFAIISDVHSQAGKLSQALDFCKENNLRPLFLGDLFDSKCEQSNSLGVYNLTGFAQDTMNAIIIQSNHQNKLIRYLRGNNVVQNYGLDVTIRELFDVGGLNRDDVLSWLESFPYGVVFRDSEGQEYRVAHAYFSSRIEVPEYTDYCLIHDVDKKHKEQMLYGIFSGRDRIEWWNDIERHSNNNWIRVCGHYHTTQFITTSIVLDGCCGEDGGVLHVYDVNKKQLTSF